MRRPQIRVGTQIVTRSFDASGWSPNSLIIHGFDVTRDARLSCPRLSFVVSKSPEVSR